MNSFVKLSFLSTAIILSGCQATSQGQTSLYERYQNQSNNKAYSIGTNGKAGAAWNAGSISEAIDLANETCRKDGGQNCNVTEINGRPAINFDLKNQNTTNLNAPKAVDAISKQTRKPLLLPGAYGVQPMTFTEIENNNCKIINTNAIKTKPENLEVELSNVAYMMSGNRYHITKIINASDDDSISVIADIYRCNQRTLASN
ncbi:hypothetical protein L4C36_09925 [Photobacterium japonica]|uniref:hypothetical protein n=1 Tax=Photobacterium japonica TaxID=2910235 RepID=UPI003D0C1F56